MLEPSLTAAQLKFLSPGGQLWQCKISCSFTPLAHSPVCSTPLQGCAASVGLAESLAAAVEDLAAQLTQIQERALGRTVFILLL